MKSHHIKNTFKSSHTIENNTIPGLPKQAELARPLLASPLSVQDQFSQIVMQGNRCFVICLEFDHDAVARSGRLSEMTALLVNLGDTVCGCTSYYVRTPNPKTLLGRGKLMEFAEQARQVGATVLVIDAPLSPAQARNIESMTGLAVRDRSATILSVFAQHARTKSARVQIEMGAALF